jgi:hypothetical protein
MRYEVKTSVGGAAPYTKEKKPIRVLLYRNDAPFTGFKPAMILPVVAIFS